VAGVVSLDDDALLDQPLKTVGENIRGNPFHRLGQELAKIPPVHENDIAEDEQTPFIAEHLDHQVEHAY
jgi:hypothetical protein